jgi:hypothetical protein
MDLNYVSWPRHGYRLLDPVKVLARSNFQRCRYRYRFNAQKQREAAQAP